MTPREEAAVRTAVRAVWAHRRREGGHRARASHSAADVLSRRLDGLEWASFTGRGYQLLREVARRCGCTGRNTPSPPAVDPSGAKFEDATFKARERLSRSRA